MQLTIKLHRYIDYAFPWHSIIVHLITNNSNYY